MSRSPVISIRVKPYKIAKLISGLRRHNHAFMPESAGKTIQAAIDIAINQVCFGMPAEPDRTSMEIVNNWYANKGRKRQTEQVVETFLQRQMAGPREIRVDPTQPNLSYEEAMEEGRRLETEMIRKAMIKQSEINNVKEPLLMSPEEIRQNSTGNPLTNDIDIGSKKSTVTDFRPMTAEELRRLSEDD